MLWSPGQTGGHAPAHFRRVLRARWWLPGPGLCILSRVAPTTLDDATLLLERGFHRLFATESLASISAHDVRAVAVLHDVSRVGA